MEQASSSDDSNEDRRLWIGNLDPRVTEYQLLKLLQKHGAIEKFDLLFHRSGPFLGQPRGYAFVTYIRKEDAEIARNTLNNVTVGQKPLKVTWAHSICNEEPEKPKGADVTIPALAMSKGEKKTDKLSQIQAIEAKLKLMERKNEEELKINDTVATKAPVVVQYQSKPEQTPISNSSFKTKHNFYKKNDRNSKPYNRNKFTR